MTKKRNKINKGKVADKNPVISNAKKIAEDNASQLVNFSFKYLESHNEKFPCFCENYSYYFAILRRIKDISSISKLEFTTNRSDTLKSHPISWEGTTEPRGFNIPEENQIVDTPYQFSITRNEHGRIHGFFILNTFYIVWFDPNHALYT